MEDKYTDSEIKALEDKSTYPEKIILCPRCGKELTFHQVGRSGSYVKCPSDGCLYFEIRGL